MERVGSKEARRSRNSTLITAGPVICFTKTSGPRNVLRSCLEGRRFDPQLSCLRSHDGAGDRKPCCWKLCRRSKNYQSREIKRTVCGVQCGHEFSCEVYVGHRIIWAKWLKSVGLNFSGGVGVQEVCRCNLPDSESGGVEACLTCIGKCTSYAKVS